MKVLITTSYRVDLSVKIYKHNKNKIFRKSVIFEKFFLVDC
jgi:hypothetical protein